ncbi:MAG TPA: hypothetical protein VFZ27_16020 [Terriglobia bacterium]|nr:hypothetical protein [Terriglobia bacterium]
MDLSQWDYVDPDFKSAVAVESDALAPPPFMDLMPEPPLENSEDLVPENGDEELPEDVYDELEEHVRTCYHCYQADSELADLCPVCGDAYLPPSLRQPHS